MSKTNAAAVLVTRYVGFCAICEEDHKLGTGEDMLLVHHGYKRPGDGFIVGDCLAVHEQPYELTCEPCVSYRTRLQIRLADTEAYLAALEANEITYLETHSRSWRTGLKEVDGFSMFVSCEHVWERRLNLEKGQTRAQVNGLQREIARMTKWIDGWTLKPVRTVEEDVAEKKRISDAARAEKQAIRDAKKKAETEKKAALATKHAANCDAIAAAARTLVEGLGEDRIARFQGRWRKDWKKLTKLINKERCWSYDHKSSTMFTAETLSNLVKLGCAEHRAMPDTQGEYVHVNFYVDGDSIQEMP